MSALATLAERIEQAEGPSRELDAEIWLALHQPGYRYPDEVLNRTPSSRQEAVGRFTHDGYGGGSAAPAYTASLDAAMTLVPDGHASPSDFVREALVGLNKRFSLHIMHWPLLTPFSEHLARYICAAALRARGAA